MRAPTPWLLSLVAATSLSGCIVQPAPRRVVYEPAPAPYPAYPAAGVVVDVAPPAPYYEAVPAVPYLGAVWIGGYWGWSGGRHQWVGGHYDAPRPGYGWRPHAWVQDGGRWRLHEGGWVRR